MVREAAEAAVLVLARENVGVRLTLAPLLKILAHARGAGPFDCIFDLTPVESFDLKPELVAARGEIPQAYKDRQRFHVVTQKDLKLLVRLYATYQANGGWRPPEIVATLDEALARLGVDRSAFRLLAITASDDAQASR